jgi:DNA mismatch endonuclease, patch repair protein
MDRVSRDTRSRNMAKIRGKNTSLEMKVRQLIWRLGYRYRLHNRNLPGTPDLVFNGRKKVIFVHGCYWHRHDCPAGQQIPKSRVNFWKAKLARNAERDKEVQEALRNEGWDILIVWGCQIKQPEQLESGICKFLGPVTNKAANN